MSDNRVKEIKNIKAILIGAAAGLILILFLAELFQAATALIAGCESGDIIIDFAGLEYGLVFPEEMPDLYFYFIYLSPVMFLYMALFSVSRILQQTTLGFWRYSMISFIIFTLGYVLLYIFYNSFPVVLQAGADSDWEKLCSLAEFSLGGRIAFVMAMVILCFLFLMILTGRINKFIYVPGQFQDRVKKGET